MLSVLLYCGLAGAILMFAGDMLLYYTPGAYQKELKTQALYLVMTSLNPTRIKLGGMCGLFAGFVSVVGSLSFYYVMRDFKVLTVLLFSFSWIAGGAYHSHFVYFGLLDRDPRYEDHHALEIIESFTGIFKRIAFGGFALALAFLLVMQACGLTLLPRWSALLNPLVLFFLLPLFKKLKQPFYLLIVGGYANLVFVIYYLFAICYLL